MLHKVVKFAPPLADKMNQEYSDLKLTIELVESVQSAVDHINKYGSNHTESIVTTDSKRFLYIAFEEILNLI